MCVEKPQALQSEKIVEAREGGGRREKRGDGRSTQASQNRDRELSDGGGAAAGEGMEGSGPGEEGPVCIRDRMA